MKRLVLSFILLVIVLVSKAQLADTLYATLKGEDFNEAYYSSSFGCPLAKCLARTFKEYVPNVGVKRAELTNYKYIYNYYIYVSEKCKYDSTKDQYVTSSWFSGKHIVSRGVWYAPMYEAADFTSDVSSIEDCSKYFNNCPLDCIRKVMLIKIKEQRQPYQRRRYVSW